MWQNIGGVKYWQLCAYQTFGSNKFVNHLALHYIRNISDKL